MSDTESQIHESGSETPEAIPPETSTEPTVKLNKDGSIPKKRGRKPGSGAKSAEQIEAGSDAGSKPSKRTQKVSFDKAQLDMMGKQLVGLHLLAAQVTGIQECAISDQEGIMLAGSIASVCEQYNLAVDGKTGAMLQLMGTAAMIYGPRYFHLKKRMQAAQAQQEEQRTVDVPSSIVPHASDVPTH